ncbi:hypothetical protein Ahy_B03g064634 isoform G [Arachis hypogaea]|uniref:Uncharacterized protein n=1 Tax=Arachis hypogaea TaxID=3818 RepID=A0A445A006_ARAHY|nr:hypothetical protein Ahy_B03g064634 isoform G [Arachis hypogaea]
MKSLFQKNRIETPTVIQPNNNSNQLIRAGESLKGKLASYLSGLREPGRFLKLRRTELPLHYCTETSKLRRLGLGRTSPYSTSTLLLGFPLKTQPFVGLES